jgi:chromosome segregation ATPase
MSKQTKVIADNEKQIGEIERAYAAVETEIGLILLSQADLPELPEESVSDAGAYGTIKSEREELEGDLGALREQIGAQKAASLARAETEKKLKENVAALNAAFTALGLAISEAYSKAFAGFFGAHQAEIASLREKLTQAEVDLAAESENKGGFVANLKATLGRPAKKSNIKTIKANLEKTLRAGGKEAFDSEALKGLAEANQLPKEVEDTFNACTGMSAEQAVLQARIEEATAQYEASSAFIKTAGLSPQKPLPVGMKIREMEKEISNKVAAERVFLARVGKRFAAAALPKAGKSKPGSGLSPEAGEAISPLLERLTVLQSEIDGCRQNIEDAKLEIRIEETTKAIASLRNQALGCEKRIEKLTAEKAEAEKKLEALSQTLKELQAQSR